MGEQMNVKKTDAKSNTLLGKVEEIIGYKHKRGHCVIR